MKKYITVTIEPYDQSTRPFAESAHYNEFLALQLAELFPQTKIEVFTIPNMSTKALVGGFVDDDQIQSDVLNYVRNEGWEAFCAWGFKQYTETSMDEEKLQDCQGELEDAIKLVKDIQGHFSCAESCETMADFLVNLEEAKTAAEELMKEIKELLKEAKEA